jgi:hypothetical protein
MCIVNLDGFDMDWALEAQTYAQIEANTTFGNLKKTNIFRVAEEALKQMKRLQNLGMMMEMIEMTWSTWKTWNIKVKMKIIC